MLFKKSETLKEYAGLSGEINFPSVKRIVRSVEEDYLVPVLGPELYNNLNTAYTQATDESTIAANLKTLLDRCRCVVAEYFTYTWAPFAELNLSDGGLRRSETANEKSAYQYQANNFREAALREGEKHTEKLYALLEDNKDAYADWVSSKAFEQYRKLFFHTAKDFAQDFASASPYRNFYAMRFKMQDVEENNIRPALGDDLYERLKEVNASPTLAYTSREAQLLIRVKKAIAYLTVGFAIPFLNVRIDGAGLSVVNLGPRSSNDEGASRAGAGDGPVEQLRKSSIDSGQTWLKSAVDFIAKYRDDFAAYLPETKEILPAPGNEAYNASFGLF